MSYPTLHEIRHAADEYWEVWERLLNAAPKLRQTIGQHSASALGWKVDGDLAPLEATERVYELGDSLYLGPVNSERSIMTVRKERAIALDTLQHIKILQRRPSRPDDALGADSLDMYVPHGTPGLAAVKTAVEELEVDVVAQSNEAHEWLSLTYEGHEFKLADHHVWDVCMKEGQALGEH
ncbi:MAG: hypothetical protein K0S68_123 [Candidatus Saccharibacteria bacterium]|jgi:hypothetical protein|nr:hypothetical protein [Candidatus Saccharibacteria bacterium]